MNDEPTPEAKRPQAAADGGLRRLREITAAAIAGIVILAAIGMLIAAFRYIEETDKFSRAKDLLLIINPFLGVVIGYYFNKVSTEARAESAETAAKEEAASARQSDQARQKAETVAEAARVDARTTRSTLQDLSHAAEKMLSQAAPALGTLGPGESGRRGGVEGGQRAEEARLELEAALARARRVMA